MTDLELIIMGILTQGPTRGDVLRKKLGEDRPLGEVSDALGRLCDDELVARLPSRRFGLVVGVPRGRKRLGSATLIME